MTFFHRLLCFGFILAATVAPGLAQIDPESDSSTSEKTIRGWLQSGEPRLAAWGAHDVLGKSDSNLIPDLLSLANRWQTLTSQIHSDESNSLRLSAEREQ
ncbi:MAG: hypothetical protein WAK48_14885 [Candidatus Acidiferrum sp.]|jgi:hypothetical protein